MPITQERIRLDNLKVSDAAGGTTPCFSATVLFDGTPIGEAFTRGRGEAIDLSPFDHVQAKLAEAEAYARRLPPFVIRRRDPRGVSSETAIAMSLDFLIELLSAEADPDRTLRAVFHRDIGDKALFVRDGALRYLKGIQLKAFPDVSAVFARIREHFGNAVVILNELPAEDAFAVWQRYTSDREAD
ncbi:hypothetical protein [Burkholderia cepacia]|uniref:hypothetical protein n=1 Tax=Burkholderia cepacia TaxID=292 RepID=UPI001589F4BD|nr:hypothetical protein [Burkholderia cepacia]